MVQMAAIRQGRGRNSGGRPRLAHHEVDCGGSGRRSKLYDVRKTTNQTEEGGRYGG